MPQTLVLEDVVDTAFDNTLQGVWTAVPGVVESYDASKQRAGVRIAVKTVSIGQDGNTDVDDVAVLTSVPVLHLGGGGFRAVFPVRRGDTVLLVFCSRAIDQWLTKGGVIDPQTDRHHDVSDAVAITGLRDFGHALKNAPSDHASIGSDTGATIEFYPAEVRVGGDIGALPTIKVAPYMTAFNQLITAISSAVSGLPGASLAITNALVTFDAAVAGFSSVVAKVV